MGCLSRSQGIGGLFLLYNKDILLERSLLAIVYSILYYLDILLYIVYILFLEELNIGSFLFIEILFSPGLINESPQGKLSGVSPQKAR